MRKKTHIDLFNTPRIKAKQEHSYKGSRITVKYQVNSEDRTDIGVRGRVWFCEILTAKNEVRHYELTEDYLSEVFEWRPSSTQNMTWSNSHHCKF